MKKIKLLFSVILATSHLFASGPDFSQLFSAGSPYTNEKITNITNDNFGNVLIIGTFDGDSLRLGGTTLHNTNSGSNDIFVAKLNAASIVVWAMSFGGSNDENATSIKSDVSGNVYISGQYKSSSLTLGNTINNLGNNTNNSFVAKLSSGGIPVWINNVNNIQDNFINDLAIDLSGNVYITGYYTGGNVQVGSLSPLLTGGINGIFVAKLDSGGIPLWSYGPSNASTAFDRSTGIAIDLSGNLFITGHFSGGTTLTFGTFTLSNFGGSDAFIVKMSNSGTVTWAYQLENGPFDEISSKIICDATGNTYITGTYDSPVIDAGTTTLNNPNPFSKDIYVVKYNTSGTVIWAKSINGDGDGDEIAIGLATDAQSNLYVAGNFNSSSILFNGQTINNHGNFDLFISKFLTNGSEDWIKDIGETGDDYATDILVKSNDNFILTGYSYNTNLSFDNFTFANSTNTGGSFDFFVAKSCSTQPQPIITVTGSQTLCLGETATLQSSAGSYYIWSTGETTQSITISNGGSYNVTASDLTGCDATSSDVFFSLGQNAPLYGGVSSSVGNLTGEVEVKLYQQQATGLYDSIATFNLDQLENYYFPALGPGNYIVRAVPNTTVFPTLLDTYFGDAYLWDSSTVIAHACATPSSLATINMIELTGTGGGIGSISGKIKEGPGFSRNIGDPLPGVDIKIGRNPGGGIAANTSTNFNGEYQFINLADGSYTIYVDIPGYVRDSSYTVIIDASNFEFINLDYKVDSNSVYIEDLSTAFNSSSIINENSFAIFPNPFSENTMIQYDLKNDATIELSLYNLLGAKVETLINTKQSKGKHQFNLTKEKLNAGVYFFTLSIDNIRSTKKIIVQ